MAMLNSLFLLGVLFYSAHATYVLNKTYDATNFFDDDSFSWYDGWDIFNKGLVNYLSMDEAMSAGIAKITNNQVYLGVDSVTKLTSDVPGPGNGRKSTRLESFQVIDNGLLIADIEHLPSGACGTWTAFWLVHDSGDGYNEIDIIENINLDVNNYNNAYTNFGSCTMKNLGETGTADGTDCTIGTTGCHVLDPSGTFGDSFNAHEGGFWATLIDADGIKVWQFPRGSEPADINAANPDPTKWGTPDMNYGVVNCDMATMFKGMQLTIDITMCGSWAGGAWPAGSTCAKDTKTTTCEQYVANNPSAFEDAYFLFNSINLYQTGVVSQSTTSTKATSTHKSTSSTVATSTHKSTSSTVATSTHMSTSSTLATSTHKSTSPTLDTSISKPTSSTSSAIAVSTDKATSPTLATSTHKLTSSAVATSTHKLANSAASTHKPANSAASTHKTSSSASATPTHLSPWGHRSHMNTQNLWLPFNWW